MDGCKPADDGHNHPHCRIETRQWNSTMHYYAQRAMGAMASQISELCLSFFPNPNILDGNFNFVHHLICIQQIFQINEKGHSWAGTRWTFIINQIFGHMQHRENEVRYFGIKHSLYVFLFVNVHSHKLIFVSLFFRFPIFMSLWSYESFVAKNHTLVENWQRNLLPKIWLLFFFQQCQT